MTVKDYIDEVSKTIATINGVVKELGQNSQYKMERIVTSFGEMFDRFCPFRVGDRVELSHTPEITNSKRWGWLGSKHFLVEGSPGVITSRDFRGGEFIFEVMFDLESWIPSSGNAKGEWSKRPDRHVYSLSEADLAPSDKEEWIIFETEAAAPSWVEEIVELSEKYD